MFTLAIHGGAGTLLRSAMTPEKETAYLQALNDALDAGFQLLKKGGTALDAVQAAVITMEDTPLFNAGKGSVFTHTGMHEMDASIMDGRNRAAGAVAGVERVKNPVELARAIMEKTGHVMLSGTGALEFAKKAGLKLEDYDYFFNQLRYDQWTQVRNEDEFALDHNIQITEKKFGTVGAVALDRHGDLAAATSTGGMTNKRYGRVGDSPLIGCGTWADNSTCAISCTGHGEVFIRAVAAYDVHCLMEYKNMSLQQAMEEVTLRKLVAMNGEGGMIGVDASGNAALVFNSEGMYRGWRNEKGEEVAIYK